MAAQKGEIDLLTIAAIFVVVFGLFVGGIQFSEGELLPADTTSRTEDQLRERIWTELNERRAAEGVGRMPPNPSARGIAQDTTNELAPGWFGGAENETDPSADTRLPNDRPFCTQIPVRVAVANASAEPTNATATAVVDALVATEHRNVLFRPSSRFRAGIGIELSDGSLYVVYRSCEQADI
jgi:hypothetical protein